MITIYHNPRCSKSREALALVQQFSAQQGINVTIIDYQKNPLALPQLAILRQQLDVPARAMVRESEIEYTVLNLAQADETSLLEAIAHHPTLLQRPIVVYRGRAIIGRPPQLLEKLFSD